MKGGGGGGGEGGGQRERQRREREGDRDLCRACPADRACGMGPGAWGPADASSGGVRLTAGEQGMGKAGVCVR